MADSKGKIKELEKVTEKLEKEVAIAKEQVLRFTAVVREAKKPATQAVEESKSHAQVATSLEDRLDALTSERLEEHGEVCEAHPQALPRRGDVEPSVPSKNPYRQRQRWNYLSQMSPDDQESAIALSSAAPSERSERVVSTSPRAPPSRGYQAVPPAAGYQWVRVEGEW